MRKGTATLPLHGGRAPRWLFDRMKRLARALVEVMVEEYGSERVLERLSDPVWFQAFGCALGFDWHSSGVTTTACGALKEGLRGAEQSLGIIVAGGKGAASRKTPDEIVAWGDRLGLGFADELVYASRMSAKVDNAAVQDGYQIYHHTMIFTPAGQWAVVQQGMNEQTGWARRYHWLSVRLRDFVCEPHAAVCCDHRGQPLNMVAAASDEARRMSAVLACEAPEKLVREFEQARNLQLPPRHSLGSEHLRPQSLRRILLSTYERQPKGFEALLGIQGVGPKTIRALALLSELVHGAPPAYEDPAKFAFAHGGKDGYPFPVDREAYDSSISFLQEALSKSRVDHTERMHAFRRLKEFGGR